MTGGQGRNPTRGGVRLLGLGGLLLALARPQPGLGAATPPAGADTGRTAAVHDSAAATAPDTTLAVADSAAIETRLLAGRGRWLLVNVWATWCQPCVAETPELVALVRGLPAGRAAALGISTDLMLVGEAEAARKVRAYRARFGVPYPLVLYSGSNDALTGRFGLGGSIPVTLLYDPAGREAGRWERRLTKADLARIRALVAGQPAAGGPVGG